MFRYGECRKQDSETPSREAAALPAVCSVLDPAPAMNSNAFLAVQVARTLEHQLHGSSDICRSLTPITAL